MEKTILIDGKKVCFKSSGALPLRYKMQFGRDFFKEFFKLVPENKLNDLQKGTLTKDDIDDMDFELFYNIAWTMAKTADSEIADPITWLDGFDVFPIHEIALELQDLLLASLQQTKKKSLKGKKQQVVARK